MNNLVLLIGFFLLVYILFQLNTIEMAIRKLRQKVDDLTSQRKATRPSAPLADASTPTISSKTPPKSSPESKPVSSPPPVQQASVSAASPPLPRTTPQPSAGTPSRFDRFLTKMWNWILYGSEEKPVGVSVEYTIATTWLLRVGILALVLCVGFFLKWSIDHGLLNEWGRVSISLVVGVGMLVGGLRMINRKYHIVGQGFIGGGFAVLYFSMYATGEMYKLLSMPVVFGVLVLITVCAGVLALYSNSMLVAIYGLVGGFLTPSLLPVVDVNYFNLFSYMILLNGAVLVLSVSRKWILLHYLAMYFSYGYFVVFSSPGSLPFTISIVALTIVFLIHGSAAYLYQIRTHTQTSILDVFQLLLNSVFAFLIGYDLISTFYPSKYVAILTLVLAIYYLVHLQLFLNTKSVDRKLTLSFLGLCNFFICFTFPLLFENQTITILWALQGFGLLWLGSRISSRFIVQISYVFFALVVFRIFIYDWGLANFGQTYSFSKDYFSAFFRRFWSLGIPIATLIGGYLLKAPSTVASSALAFIDPQNDTKPMISFERRKIIFGVGGLFLLFLYLSSETTSGLTFFSPGFVAGGLSIMWLLFALVLLVIGIALSRKWSRYAGLGLIGIVVLKVFIHDTAGMDLIWRVFAFFIVGTVLVGSSIYYIKSNERFKI